MKRLITSHKDKFEIGDLVMWKKHPYDDSVYKVVDINDDETMFIDNGVSSYINVKPSTIEHI